MYYKNDKLYLKIKKHYSENAGLICYFDNFIFCGFSIAFILLLILSVKGIYPFGSGTLSYFDMSQTLVPELYHLWDIINGHAYWFINWNMNFGVPYYPTIVLPDIVLLYYFIPRTSVLDSVSYIVISRIVFAGMGMHFLISKILKDKFKLFKLCASISYAFSGFFILYYIIVPWLDFGMLFPILLYALIKIDQDKFYLLYVTILSYFLVNSLYFSLILFMQLFLFGGVLLLFFREKVQKCIKVYRIVSGTFFASALTLFHTAGIFEIMLKSNRFSSTNSLNNDFSLVDKIYVFAEKIFSLWWNVSAHFNTSFITKVDVYYNIFPYIIFSTVIIFQIYKLIKDKLQLDTLIALLFLCIVPLFVEGSNLLMHLGSYACFPVRFSYVLSCVVILITSYSIKIVLENDINYKDSKNKNNIKRFKIIFCLVGFFSLVLLGHVGYNNYIHGIFMSAENQWYVHYILLLLYVWLICFFLSRVCIYDFHNCTNIFSVFVMLVSIISAMVYMGVRENPSFSDEQKIEYLYKTNAIQSRFFNNHDIFARYKNIDASLNRNYSQMLNIPSLSGWVVTNSFSYQKLFRDLGYSVNFTDIEDQGGSIFTDALFGIKYAVSKRELDRDLYTLNKKVDDFSIYDVRYKLPFGVIINNEYTNFKFKDIDIAYNQNSLFKMASGLKDNLLFEYQISDFGIWNDNNSSIDISVSGPLYIYYATEKVLDPFYSIDNSYNRLLITIDEKEVKVPYYGNDNNNFYPGGFVNGLLYLGTFKKGEKVNLGVYPQKYINKKNGIVKLYSLDINLLNRYCEKAYSSNGISYSFDNGNVDISLSNSRTGSFLLLPIQNSSNWFVSIDGKSVEQFSVFGGLMGIPLNKDGMCKIRLDCYPKYYRYLNKFTVIVILILLFFCFYSTKNQYKNNVTIFNKIFAQFWLYSWMVVATMVVFVPFSMFMINLIMNILYKIKGFLI